MLIVFGGAVCLWEYIPILGKLFQGSSAKAYNRKKELLLPFSEGI